MLKWNQLNQQLETVANRHLQLAGRFQVFAKFVTEQVTAQNFHIKDISASLHLEENYFTTTFVGRTLRFAFSSALSENGSLLGTVTCALMKATQRNHLFPSGNSRSPAMARPISSLRTTEIQSSLTKTSPPYMLGFTSSMKAFPSNSR
jgi:hypothetical protein